MPPVLIVARNRPDLLARFRQAFADFEGLEIVVDRRSPRTNYHPERRLLEIDAALQTYGWALSASPESEAASERQGARRILIADDHEDTRHLLEWVLRRAGHDVMQADDGAIAVVKTRAWRPDVVIVDMFMPEKDGMEVIREIRRAPRAPKILAISAGWRAGGVRVMGSPNDLDVLDDARAVGADAVMAKPIDPKMLLGVVEKLLVS
ncbi:MAG TPA: response regulator [Terriglobales bacterium]|nr:response regulator [Terriglobales bacterium]